MFPFLPLITSLLPGLANIVSGSASGSGSGADNVSAVIERMVDAIKKATSDNVTPAAAQSQIDANPALKLQLQQDLAQIALDELKEQNRAKEEAAQIDLELYKLDVAEREQAREDEFRRYARDLQDRQEARSVQEQLAEDHNPLAWVAPILAFILVGLLFYLLHGIMVAREPVVNKDVFNVVLGALVTAFTTVVSFYFGSSVGSRQKDDAVRSGKLVPGPGTGDDGGGGNLPPSPAPPANGRTPGTPGLGGGAMPKPSSLPPSTGPVRTFREKAPDVMSKLRNDLGLTPEQAAGILGNIGVESAGFRAMQELSPRGGRGGWGWVQWTGPRRVAFETWADGKGLNRASDEANYGFLLVELQGSEERALRNLRRQSTVESATETFMELYERPGVPALDRRIGLARLALQEYGRTYNA